MFASGMGTSVFYLKITLVSIPETKGGDRRCANQTATAVELLLILLPSRVKKGRKEETEHHAAFSQVIEQNC